MGDPNAGNKKHTQHASSTKTECDYLNGCIKKRSHIQKLIRNGEPRDIAGESRRRSNNGKQRTRSSSSTKVVVGGVGRRRRGERGGGQAAAALAVVVVLIVIV